MKPLRWNAKAGKFIDARGHFVPVSAVRDAADQAIVKANRQASAIAQQLIDGQISLAQFETLLRDEAVKSLIAHAMLGKGGKSQMSPADYGRVGRFWRDELVYLRARVAAIKSGEQPLNGQLRNIAQLYIEAGREMFHIFDDITAAQTGFDEEHNVLHGDEHCSGCITEEKRGWVARGKLKQPGTRLPCIRRCKCSKKQRNSVTKEVRE